MKKSLLLVGSSLLLLMSASACGSAAPESPSITEEAKSIPTEPAQTPPRSTAEVSIMIPPTSVTAEPVSRELVEKARADLSERYGIDPSQISVAEARAVDWPDASLGCPQPGMAYAAVITPGYWILLTTGNVQYPYHTNLDSTVLLCETDPVFSGSNAKNDNNIVDGWPNQTRDKDVIIVTPTPRK